MSEFNTSPELVLFPAIDLAGGKAVRLVQGEADSATNYGDPVDAAEDWIEQGAEWIHLVDLDAAFGRGSNAEVIAAITAAIAAVWQAPTGFVVRHVKRVSNAPAWNRAGREEQTYSRF